MPVVIHDTSVWLPRTNTWIYNEIVGLNENWEPWVIANRTQNRSEFPFDNVYSLREQTGKLRWFIEMLLRRSTLLAHAPSITRFCKSLSPGILHSHFGTTGWRNLNLASKLGAAHVVTFYGFDVTRIPRSKRWRRRYQRLFKEVDMILCEGPHMADTIAALGCPRDKLTVHRLGVHLDKLPFRLRDRSKTSIDFLMAGSFREKKGMTDGLRALAKFHHQNPQQEWTLTIVGGAGGLQEGELIADELQSIAEQNSISERITYTGYLSHDELIARGIEHDVFLCPSVASSDGDTEGGAPVVMIEMAALGLQVAATSHCDMPYVIGEQNRSLLVAEKDVDALARSITWLAEHRDEWDAISNENRKHIEDHFDHTTQGEHLSKIYDDLSATRP